MSDTPRTDERDHEYYETPWNNWVESAFARELERELAELTSENERLAAGNSSMEKEIPMLRHKLETAKAALVKLHGSGEYTTSAGATIAREALAAIK